MSEEETRECIAAWETADAAPSLDQTLGEIAGEMEALLLACEEEAAALKAKLESTAKILGLMAKRMPPHRAPTPDQPSPGRSTPLHSAPLRCSHA